jgi:hypothetical protein
MARRGEIAGVRLLHVDAPIIALEQRLSVAEGA